MQPRLQQRRLGVGGRHQGWAMVGSREEQAAQRRSTSIARPPVPPPPCLLCRWPAINLRGAGRIRPQLMLRGAIHLQQCHTHIRRAGAQQRQEGAPASATHAANRSAHVAAGDTPAAIFSPSILHPWAHQQLPAQRLQASKLQHLGLTLARQSLFPLLSPEIGGAGPREQQAIAGSLAAAQLPLEQLPLGLAASCAPRLAAPRGHASQATAGGPPQARVSSQGGLERRAAAAPPSASTDLPSSPQPSMDLSAADRAMVRLYMAGCFHHWDQLPGG